MYIHVLIYKQASSISVVFDFVFLTPFLQIKT